MTAGIESLEVGHASVEWLSQRYQTARFLGIMAAGGHITKKGVYLRHRSPELAAELREFFQTYLAGSAVRQKELILTTGTSTYQTDIVISGSLELFSDFGQNNWFDTLKNKHAGIYQDWEMTTAFLSAIFDVKGTLMGRYTHPNIESHRLRFHTTSENEADTLLELLDRIDVRGWQKVPAEKDTPYFFVENHQVLEIGKFAKMIYSYSQVPDKLQVLDVYRRRPQKIAVTGPEHLPRIEVIHHSADAAYIIGAVCGASHYDKKNRSISFISSNHALLEHIQSRGQDGLNLPGYIHTIRLKEKMYSKLSFNGKDLQNALDDLSKEGWAETILEKYQWISAQTKFVRAFLEGFLDRTGSITYTNSGSRVKLHLPNVLSGTIISQMLVQIGVNSPMMKIDDTGRAIVSVNRFAEVRRLAEELNLNSQPKRQTLEEYRKDTF